MTTFARPLRYPPAARRGRRPTAWPSAACPALRRSAPRRRRPGSNCTSPSASTQMPPRPSSSTVPQPGSRLAPTISSMPFGDIFSTSAPSSVTSGAARLTLCIIASQAARSAASSARFKHDAAGLGLVRQRRGLRLQHHRIADALGHCGGFVRGAGELAVGHPDAGGGEHLLAQPFGLRALAELGQPLDRLGLSRVARRAPAFGRNACRARWRAASGPTSARTPPGLASPPP